MIHAAVVFPQFQECDVEIISSIRSAHDHLYFPRLKPRFLLVYPIETELAPFTQEIHQQTELTQPFEVILKSVAIHKDYFNNQYHVSLMPDAGFSDLLKLYYAMHGNMLRSHLLVEANYVPHLEIANSPNASECLELAHQLNRRIEPIRCFINGVSIINCNQAKESKIVDFISFGVSNEIKPLINYEERA